MKDPNPSPHSPDNYSVSPSDPGSHALLSGKGDDNLPLLKDEDERRRWEAEQARGWFDR